MLTIYAVVAVDTTEELRLAVRELQDHEPEEEDFGKKPKKAMPPPAIDLKPLPARDPRDPDGPELVALGDHPGGRFSELSSPARSYLKAN